MDCSKVVEKLSAYVDGELDERTLELLESHLAACSSCRRELAALNAIVAAAGNIEILQPPKDLKSRILNSIKRAQELDNQCAKVADLLSAYVDGELPEKQVRQVEAHVSICEQCAKEVNAISTLVNASSQVVQVEPPSDLRSRIIAAISREPVKQSWANRISSFLRTQTIRLAYVGTAILASVIVLLNMPTQSPKQNVRVAIEHRPHKAAATATVVHPKNEPAMIKVAQQPKEQSQSITKSRPVKSYRSVRRSVVASVHKFSKPKHIVLKTIENKPLDKTDVAAKEPETSTTETEESPVVDVAIVPDEPEVESTPPIINRQVTIKVPPPPTIDSEKVAEMMQKIKAEAAMRRDSSRTASIPILKWRL